MTKEDEALKKAGQQLENTQKLPEGIVRELGRVSVAFGRMELAVELLFAALVDQNQHVGRALLSIFGGLDLKLKAIETVYLTRYGKEDPHWRAVETVLSEVRAAANERHRVIHTAYAIGPDGSVGTIRTLRADKGFRVKTEDNITEESIHAVAESGLLTFMKLLNTYETLTKNGKAYKFPEPPAGV